MVNSDENANAIWFDWYVDDGRNKSVVFVTFLKK